MFQLATAASGMMKHSKRRCAPRLLAQECDRDYEAGHPEVPRSVEAERIHALAGMD